MSGVLCLLFHSKMGVIIPVNDTQKHCARWRHYLTRWGGFMVIHVFLPLRNVPLRCVKTKSGKNLHTWVEKGKVGTSVRLDPRASGLADLDLW